MSASAVRRRKEGDSENTDRGVAVAAMKSVADQAATAEETSLSEGRNSAARTQPKERGRRNGRVPAARAMQWAPVASPKWQKARSRCVRSGTKSEAALAAMQEASDSSTLLLPLLPLREAAAQEHEVAVAHHEAAVAAMQGASVAQGERYGACVNKHEAAVAAMKAASLLAESKEGEIKALFGSLFGQEPPSAKLEETITGAYNGFCSTIAELPTIGRG